MNLRQKMKLIVYGSIVRVVGRVSLLCERVVMNQGFMVLVAYYWVILRAKSVKRVLPVGYLKLWRLMLTKTSANHRKFVFW